jgi:signal transduction histidine kinase
VLVPDETGSRIRVQIAVGPLAAQLTEDSYERAGTLTDLVLSTTRPTLVDEATQAAPNAGLAASMRVGPAMLLPLVGVRDGRGVLAVSRVEGRRTFADADLAMGTTFTTHAVMALELGDMRRDQQRVALLEDRARIARDLHDHVIQQLFAAGMALQGLGTKLEPNHAAVVHRVVDRLDQAIKQIRTSIFQLRPQDYTRRTLRAAVVDVATEVTDVLGFKPRLTFEGPVDVLSHPELVEDVVAVVRESLTNTAKHAHAQHAWVLVSAEPERLTVRVGDDGVGSRSSGRRSGLENLAERATWRGGRLVLDDPTPAVGTVIEWSVPLP